MHTRTVLGNRSISHAAYNLYWPSGTSNRKNMWSLTAVKKDILDKVTIENRTDLVSHPYCTALDRKEIDGKPQKHIRKTRVVNLYDNRIGKGQVWEGSSPAVRRVIQNIPWRSVT